MSIMQSSVEAERAGAKTAKAPYGTETTYADPGYQSDGVKRYPLDTEEHCRAAWSYINQADNAAKYTADQLATIKSKIKAAGKKYGISFADAATKSTLTPDIDDVWNDRPVRSAHNPDGLPERTVTRAKVMEFGPVTFPANPHANAGIRSMTDRYYDQLRQRDSGAYEAACRAASSVITDFTGRPDARSAGGGEPDARPGNGRASSSPSAQQRLDADSLRIRGILT